MSNIPLFLPGPISNDEEPMVLIPGKKGALIEVLYNHLLIVIIINV
jgi:hypothetical protein